MKLTPKTARTYNAILSLKRDNVTSGDNWITFDEDTVSIAHQKALHPATGVVVLSRAVFENFVRWYETGSMVKKGQRK